MVLKAPDYITNRHETTTNCFSRDISLWEGVVVLKGPSFVVVSAAGSLTAESVQGTSLALEGVDHIHGGHCFPLSVLGVRHGVTDNVLQENLQYSTGLLIDQAGDTLDTTSASKTADGRLGDTLDIVTQDLPVTLGAPLSKTFSSFTTSRHDCVFKCKI